ALRRPTPPGASTVRIVDGAVAVAAVDVLASVSDELRREFVAAALGAVRDHDGRHQGNLIDTLRVFLECDGSWVRTSNALHLHQNSVRYRIARVEELTGRDLGSTKDRVDLYLALLLL
ncbi:PucR family transcriptional regulator, partial [Microbacterium sp.]|uniref:PucR family transcriptional regulator n=1 Tax=Microbacterium sp. TaxID=51671 RepID=UPI003C76FE28